MSIGSIQDRELGPSVRSKLNDTIAEANKIKGLSEDISRRVIYVDTIDGLQALDTSGFGGWAGC